MAVRRAAVAGTWYPSSPDRLTAQIEAYIADASELMAGREAEPRALIVPHAGLVYSGPVAAYAYRLLAGRSWDTIVLVGPSHYLAFDGAAVWPQGAFATPLGNLAIDEATVVTLESHCGVIARRTDAHAREHSIEMQLPFLARYAPDTPIVPIVMGEQTRATACALGDGLAAALGGRRALVIASSDLSHFYDAATAAALDARVMHHVSALDPDGLLSALEERPDHACGGGPIVSVLRAARRLGAKTATVLKYGDSGDVSGDKSSVVGYMSAAVY